MNIYFVLVGFENNRPFVTKFTYTELALCSGKNGDTEMFYALSELHGTEISNMHVDDSLFVRLNRDNSDDVGLIKRCTEYVYNHTIVID